MMRSCQINALQRLVFPGAIALLLSLAVAPARGQSVSFSPGTLSLSPSGPYSVPRDAAVGSQLKVQYMGELYPVTVQTVDSTPVFDPDNSRVRS